MAKSKAVLPVLILSLALNLFFVGGILYRVASFQKYGPRPMPHNTSWIVRDLSEERQLELAPLLEQGRADARQIREELFASQRKVDELMTSSDYDSLALDSAFAELRSHSLSYQQLSHEQMLKILGELSAEERATAREFMQRRGPRDGFRGDRPPRPDFEGRPTSERKPPR